MAHVKTPIAEHQVYVATIPWIRKLKKPVPCQGWHSHSSGKRACRNRAHWSYRHLSGVYSGVESGTRRYCWNHLMSRGMYGSMEDEARMERWMEAHPPPWGDL